MSKEIKDYLHLYLGCECAVTGVSESDNNTFKLTGISYDDTQRVWWGYFENTEFGYAQVEDIWIHLRLLSDMSFEEAEELEWSFPIMKDDVKTWLDNLSAGDIPFLLKQGFDLFGLIESGLAIDKTKTPLP